MKFVTVKEEQELFRNGQYISANVFTNINADQILFIRNLDEYLLVFMAGCDKPIKISDDNDIKKLLKECNIKALNE